ncbi:hypothetical protein SNE40_019814 [Patella caerulea]|uniref:Calcium-responsive transcription factor n=1 Tax=Patella caerulea TaxID=87958 RepID=A0AAN8IZ14_PATCE
MTKDDENAVSSSDMVMVGIPVTYVTSSTQGTQLFANPTVKSELLENQTSDLVNPGAVLTTLNSNHSTLQNLLATPINNPVYNSLDQIQIITVNTPSDLLAGGFTDGTGRLLQVLPSGLGTGSEYATIIAVQDPSEYLQLKDDTTDITENSEMVESLVSADGVSTDLSNVVSSESVAQILMPPPPPPVTSQQVELPPDCPSWAARLKDCEKIGDSYRGYVESEVDLDLLLTYHKQQTQSFWGTRQSPSPGKPSTRLMWKSQYVPFDGIPFVNTGSRAVVQECQYGPRRKGNCKSKGDPDTRKFKQTCPARIYVKKVRKFPEFAVDFLYLDKKSLKAAMDRAFQELKQRGIEGLGQERHYVQLPTEKAHQFHDEGPVGSLLTTAPSKTVDTFPEEEEEIPQPGLSDSNIHPKLAIKIRELVAAGETGVYTIRKQLRCYVTKDMYPGTDMPERHDWTLFPTVNNIKNHIHQALKDIENGTLALTATTVNVEIITNTEASALPPHSSDTLGAGEPIVWPRVSGTPIPETVTVTLTQNAGDDGHHVISRIETHLSDGTTHVSNTITPETAQLLSRLHPGMFPAGSLLQNGDLVVGSTMSNTMVEDTDHTVMDTSHVESGLGSTEPPLHIVDETCPHIMEEDEPLQSKTDDLNDTSMVIGTYDCTCDSAMDPLESATNL